MEEDRVAFKFHHYGFFFLESHNFTDDAFSSFELFIIAVARKGERFRNTVLARMLFSCLSFGDISTVFVFFFPPNIQGWPLALALVLCAGWLKVVNIGAFKP